MSLPHLPRKSPGSLARLPMCRNAAASSGSGSPPPPNGRRIKIYFEHYLRRDLSRPATSTIVSIEGGPGYSTTADRGFRLRRAPDARRGLVLIDLRGTGKSHAITRHSTQNTDYPARGGRCAEQLGPNRDFYDTSQSVQDIGGAAGAAHREDRSVRRWYRLLRRAGLCAALPASAALPGAGRPGRWPAPVGCCPTSDPQPPGDPDFLPARPQLPRHSSSSVPAFAAVHRPRAAASDPRHAHDAYGDRVKARVNQDTLAQTVMAAEGSPTVYRNLLGAVGWLPRRSGPDPAAGRQHHLRRAKRPGA